MHLNTEQLTLAQQAEEDNFKLLTVNVDVNSYPTLEDQEPKIDSNKMVQRNFMARSVVF